MVLQKIHDLFGIKLTQTPKETRHRDIRAVVIQFSNFVGDHDDIQVHIYGDL